MLERPVRDIVEIFGFNPTDISEECREHWSNGVCPFTFNQCHKTNHDKSITYGVCSVTTPYGDCVICPNRLYANKYQSLREVSKDVFGPEVPLLMYGEYLERRNSLREYVVALGMNSGGEVQIKGLSMDWVLARIMDGKLVEYIGIEVQSIDITGNYRANWNAYKNIECIDNIPPSEHGLNWANVHKRLIPQLIRKGIIYSKSVYVTKGLFFIVPDVVYRKFEEILGGDMTPVDPPVSDSITVHTYSLGLEDQNGHRELQIERKLTFSLEEMSRRFISGPNLPPSGVLDQAVKDALVGELGELDLDSNSHS